MPADQCGVINKWLAKSENAQQLNALIGASPPLSPPAGKATVSALSHPLLRRLPDHAGPDSGRTLPLRRRADGAVAHRRRLPARIAQRPAAAGRGGRRARLRRVAASKCRSSPAAPRRLRDEKAWIAAPQGGGAAVVRRHVHASPPLSPPASVATLGDYMFDSPPTSLMIAPDQLCRFLRVAFRFWVDRTAAALDHAHVRQRARGQTTIACCWPLDVPIVFGRRLADGRLAGRR